MSTPLPHLLLTSSVAALVGGAAALVLRSGPAEVSGGAVPVVRSGAPSGDAPVDAAAARGVEDLRRLTERLAADVEALRAQVGQLASARSAVEPAPAEGDGSGAAILAPTAGDEAFFEEVSRVLERIDEEKAAEARVAEMEKREDEERKAYAEYDDVQADLSDALAKLTASMPMSNADRRDLEGLMNVQIDRMRELTRDWASGDFTDEEIAERFMAERREHRQAAIALLGQERIPAYRKFLQQGGVGGRFSFYTAPWEEWSVEAGED